MRVDDPAAILDIYRIWLAAALRAKSISFDWPAEKTTSELEAAARAEFNDEGAVGATGMDSLRWPDRA